MNDKIFKDVKNYYGEVLASQDDLKTSACCVSEEIPGYIKNILAEISDEVMNKFYGCGSPIPLALDGQTVLDLGSGSGRDCFIMSKLVGEKGSVIGIDMTENQLQVAQENIDLHTQRFGFSKANVEFRLGNIEDLTTAHIEDDSIDLVTSNCVLNLAADKENVFREIFRVLKPGGELYFSDVFSSRRIPKPLQDDPVLRGECLGGALYTEDFRRLCQRYGCQDVRTISSRELDITDEKIASQLGSITFYSNTYRAFKMPLEDRCEDYGQIATYQGSIEHSPTFFYLDDHHVFEKNRPMLVCSNTARMLSQSRYHPHFSIQGDESTHYGLFDCVPQNKMALMTTLSEAPKKGGCC